MTARNLVWLLAIVLFVPPARGGQETRIVSSDLNLGSGTEIHCSPGARIEGTVVVEVSSTAFFTRHTGVFFTSWERDDGHYSEWLDSPMPGGEVEVSINATVPAVVGTYYLCFHMGRGNGAEVFDQVRRESFESLFNDGKAIRLIVGTPPPETVESGTSGGEETISLEPGEGEEGGEDTVKPDEDYQPGRSLPVEWTVRSGSPFVGALKVGDEERFSIIVETGWGDEGRLDSINLYSPDGQIYWSVKPEGRGWEEGEIVTDGKSGLWRIEMIYSGPGERSGTLDVEGLSVRDLYPLPETATDSGGSGLDAEERAMMRDLYALFSDRGEGISSEESDLLERLEDYFRSN